MYNIESENLINISINNNFNEIYDKFKNDKKKIEYYLRFKNLYEIFIKNNELSVTIELFSQNINTFINEKKFRGEELKEFDEINIFFSQYNEKYDLNIFSSFLALFIIKIILNNSSSLKKKKYIYTHNSLDNIINEIENLLNNLILWIEHSLKIQINCTKTHKFLFRIISYLEHSGLISSVKKNDNTVGFKTEKYIYMYNLEKNYISFNINVSLCEFNLFYKKNQIYIYTSHFTSLQPIFKKNITTNEIFEFEDYFYLNKIAKNGIQIDWKLYEKLLKIIIDYHNLDENLIEDYINKTLSTFNLSDKTKQQKNSKLLSNLLYIQNLINFKKLNFLGNEKIYFPFSFDFRGRFYLNSPVSPTNSKLSRLCINYGTYSKKELDNETNLKNKTFNIINNLTYMIEEWKKNEEIETNSKILDNSLIWLLINLSKWDKKKIGYEIEIENFIKYGINTYNEMKKNEKNLQEKTKMEDFLEIKQIMYIINNIKEKNYIKSAISKDATASGFQHIIKILGENSEESLKYCNLLSEKTWYDTYSIIIQKFKTTNDITWDDFDIFFNRNSLKKTIMTENYSASYRTCFINFSEICELNLQNEIKKEKIKKIFKLFYNFLTKNNNDLFFNKSTKFLIESVIEDGKKLKLIDGSICLHYNEKKEGSVEVFIEKKRYTKKINKITTNFDRKKTITSSKANVAHTADAGLIREMNKKWKNIIVTVHDCFLIDYAETTNFIEEINNIMKKNIFADKKYLNIKNKNIYSIFILL